MLDISASNVNQLNGTTNAPDQDTNDPVKVEEAHYFDLGVTHTFLPGLQVGAESKALVFLFMTQESLDRFRDSHGWAGGVDASVALLKVGANGDIDANSARAPTLAFVMTNSGLMADLSLEGTKITKIQ